MTGRLEGKVAAITGAASGFGAATARRFVAEGCRVVLGDIQLEHGAALAKELGKAAVFVPCNVTNEQHIAALVDRAVSEFGALDIMFNNAGIVGAVGPIATTPADEWSATLDVLLNGVFYGMKHARARDAAAHEGLDHQHGEHGGPHGRPRPARVLRGEARRRRVSRKTSAQSCAATAFV